jgi:micrococcal nuclease
MMRHLFVFLMFVSHAYAAEYPARVVGITDGDTLTVLTAKKTQVKIRLAGIDAPESGQDFGTRAKQAASSLAFGKAVTIIERDTDRYGRTVAEVILPGGRSLES